MAQGVIKTLSEDFIHCPICTQSYNQPKILPCLHSFCLQCLSNWSSQSYQSFRCPACRCTVDLPNSGVNGFPNNFFLVSLMERLQEASRLSKQRQDYSCNICRCDTSNMFCLGCKMHICYRCKETHDRLTRNNDHPMVPSEKLTDHSYLQKMLCNQAPICDKHKENVRYYCTQCRQLACQVCATVSHQGHQTLKEIESRITSVKVRIETLMERCSSQRSRVQEMVNQTSETIEKIKDHTSRLLSRVEARYEQLLGKLHSDKEKLKDEIHKFEDGECKSLETLTNWLQTMDSTQRMTHKLLERNNSWEILEMERKYTESWESLLIFSGTAGMWFKLPDPTSLGFHQAELAVMQTERMKRRRNLPDKNFVGELVNGQRIRLNEDSRMFLGRNSDMGGAFQRWQYPNQK